MIRDYASASRVLEGIVPQDCMHISVLFTKQLLVLFEVFYKNIDFFKFSLRYSYLKKMSKENVIKVLYEKCYRIL